MQTVSFAGSNYAIPTETGENPWLGLSDLAVAVAGKALNTGGGAFTLLADINLGASFGLVSTYYKSRSSNIASAGQVRLAVGDTIKFRNNANDGDLTLSVDGSDNLAYEATKVLLSGAVVNADINAAAAIAYSKLNLSDSIVNADINSAAAIAYSKLAISATVSETEIGYLAGVTSAIQTQLDAKAPTASPTFSGTITTPLTASRAVVTGASSQLAASPVTATELGFVSGVTSSIQAQLNALGSPKVKQIVFATSTTTATNTNSGAWTATALTASITPSSTASKVLALASGAVSMDAAGENASTSLLRGGTNIGGTAGLSTTLTSGTSIRTPVGWVFVDAPSTTSATTYGVGVKRGGGTGSAVWLPVNETGVLVLMEVETV